MVIRPNAAHNVLAIWILAVLLCLGGCQKAQDFFKTDRTRLLGPEKVIRQPAGDGMPINPILPSIGVVDQVDELVPDATFPQMEDLEYSDEDYVIGPSDILEVRILDLFQEGLETPVQRQVTESGYIDLPLIPLKIKAAERTKDDLIQAIKDAYSPEILLDPTVSVMIVGRRQSTFSIRGAVGRPNTYSIIRPDMRLMEALALAGDVVQQNIRYIYIIRPERARRAGAGPPENQVEPGELPELPQLPELPGAPEPTTTTLAPDELFTPAPEPTTTPLAPDELFAPAPEPSVPEAEPTAPSSPEPAELETKQAVPAPEPQEPQPQPQTPDEAIQELQQLVPSQGRVTRPVHTEPPPLSELFCFSEMAELIGGSSPHPARLGNEDGEGPDYEWSYTNGRWIRAPVAPTVATEPVTRPVVPTRPAIETAPVEPVVPEPVVPLPPPAPAPLEAADPFGWLAMDKTGLARIIAINLRQLNMGDPRMNIVIRDDDIIQVPWLDVGEYYVMGEVISPGVYRLSGRRITIKQAVASAGNMNLLAWPENAILIRRVGYYQEQTIPLNLEAMFRGDEPDIFLKPDDMICVGTDVRSIFYAVVRNAFRMTYGFGFIYDRNFSDPVFLTPKSNRFTRL